MSSWRAVPEGTWNDIDGSLRAGDPGVGPFDTSYCVLPHEQRMLNGRVSALFTFAQRSKLNGAGLICRADRRFSFTTLFVVSSPASPGQYSIRIGAFKHGAWSNLREMKQPVALPSGPSRLALQFFSGDLVGSVETSIGSVVEMSAKVPELAFPGDCGVVRFYDTHVLVNGFTQESLGMEAKLPEPTVNHDNPSYDFKVFVSHSSRDKGVVKLILGRLRDAGISYWVDDEQISFGDPIVHKIEQGLERSKYVLACLSEGLKQSGWCRAEYSPILHREFTGDTSRRVIPILLDSSDAVRSTPLLLSDKMRARWQDPDSFQALLKFLASS